MTSPRQPKARGWLSIVLIVFSATLSVRAGPNTSGDENLQAKINGAVVLPPYFVEEDKAWRYAEIPGYQCLWRCPDRTAVRLLTRLHRLDELLTTLLPAEFQFRSAVPRTMILTSAGSVSSQARDIVESGFKGDRVGSVAADVDRRWLADANIRFLPNLMLNDDDAVAQFVIVDAPHVNVARLAYTPEQVQFLLEHSLPAPPPWLVAGFVRLFADIEFGGEAVTLPRYNWRGSWNEDNVWTDPDAPRRLLPLQDFFALDGIQMAQERSPIYHQWTAQAGLFVRWGIDPSSPERRTRFWKFVRAAVREPVTDATAQECFGVTLADLRDQLSDYLPFAARGPIQIEPNHLDAPPTIKAREARPEEVGRILADWQRMEFRYVKATQPAYARVYLAAARRTLDLARKREPHDGGLAAIAGLLEFDAGETVAAVPLLERAVEARVVRPKVYLDLALLRSRDVLPQLSSTDRRRSAEPVLRVLAPLLISEDQAPPLLEAYSLTAEVYVRSRAAISDFDLAALERAADNFPKDVRFIWLVAVLEARHGSSAKAADFATRGLRVSRAPQARAAFEALLKSIAVRGPVGPEFRPTVEIEP